MKIDIIVMFFDGEVMSSDKGTDDFRVTSSITVSCRCFGSIPMPIIATEWTEIAQSCKFFTKTFGQFKFMPYLCTRFQGRPPNKDTAEIAQLVEHNLAKVGVASSSLVFRSS